MSQICDPHARLPRTRDRFSGCAATAGAGTRGRLSGGAAFAEAARGVESVSALRASRRAGAGDTEGEEGASTLTPAAERAAPRGAGGRAADFTAPFDLGIAGGGVGGGWGSSSSSSSKDS